MGGLSQLIVDGVGSESDAMRLLEPSFGLACGSKLSYPKLFGESAVSSAVILPFLPEPSPHVRSASIPPSRKSLIVDAIAVTA